MTRRPPGPGPAVGTSREWIAGRRLSPFYVMEGGPYRPHVLLWTDADNGLIVGFEVVPDSLSVEDAADALVGLMGTAPGYVGPPRPRSVRVADSALGEALRARLAADVTLRVAPTPELDEVMRVMARSMGPGKSEPAYIETVDTTPAIVARFFEAARRFSRLAPWKIADDGQVLRLDAPAFGIENAVVSVIGALGQNLGFVLFDSADDFQDFAALPQVDLEATDGPGVHLFSVNFERAKRLPAPMRKEARRHRWPASAKDPWPWIMQSDEDGLRRPVSVRDYHLATACLDALATFFARHASIFALPPESPVRETLTVEDLPGPPAVTITAPHPEIGWDVA